MKIRSLWIAWLTAMVFFAGQAHGLTMDISTGQSSPATQSTVDVMDIGTSADTASVLLPAGCTILSADCAMADPSCSITCNALTPLAEHSRALEIIHHRPAFSAYSTTVTEELLPRPYHPPKKR